MSASALQPRVDLRVYDVEIEDQEIIGSCTVNATCAAIEWMMSRAHDHVDLLRLLLYYETRALEGRIGKESSWDYNIGNTDSKPSAPSYAYAATEKITSFHYNCETRLC